MRFLLVVEIVLVSLGATVAFTPGNVHVPRTLPYQSAAHPFQSPLHRPVRDSVQTYMGADPIEILPTLIFLAGVAASVVYTGDVDKMKDQLSTAVSDTTSSVKSAAVVEPKEETLTEEIKEVQEVVKELKEAVEEIKEIEVEIKEELEEAEEVAEEIKAVAKEVKETKPDPVKAISEVRREVASTVDKEMEKEARIREAAAKRAAKSEPAESTPQKTVSSVNEKKGKISLTKTAAAASTAAAGVAAAASSDSESKRASTFPATGKKRGFFRKAKRVAKKIIAPWRKWKNIS